MIYIRTDVNNKIEVVHYQPFDDKNGYGLSEDELKQTGFLIENIPDPEQKENQTPIAYYTKEKGVWYEYEDIPNAYKYGVPENVYDEILADYTLSLMERGLA